jgi:hypothetical protein
MDRAWVEGDAHRLARCYRLADRDPADTGPLKAADKPRAGVAPEGGIEGLAELQSKLHAQNRWAVLVVKMHPELLRVRWR